MLSEAANSRSWLRVCWWKKKECEAIVEERKWRVGQVRRCKERVRVSAAQSLVTRDTGRGDDDGINVDDDEPERQKRVNIWWTEKEEAYARQRASMQVASYSTPDADSAEHDFWRRQGTPATRRSMLPFWTNCTPTYAGKTDALQIGLLNRALPPPASVPPARPPAGDAASTWNW